MKIALYSPSWPPGKTPNGIVTYASYMVPALRSLGHQVYILTHNAAASDDPFTLDLTKYERPRSVWLRLMFKLSPQRAQFVSIVNPLIDAVKDLSTNNKLEVLEIEESFGWAVAISKLKLVPVVLRLHGPWFINKRFADQAREQKEGEAIRSATVVTSPSKIILDRVISHYGLHLKNVSVFKNPISPIETARHWRLNECVSDSILFVGRFDEIKGGDLVLLAFGKLAGHYPQLTLTFIGTDDGVKGQKLDEFARRYLSESARSRLTYIGSLYRDEVQSYRSRHFVTVCASRSEILPYSVLEAMAYGCPVVSSDVGGIPELITDGFNGKLFPSGDLDRLIAAIKAMLDDKGSAKRFGSNALITSREAAPDLMAGEAIRVYSQAISERP
jgi:glycosyltransferase involved in cell wall biosynthesis